MMSEFARTAVRIAAKALPATLLAGARLAARDEPAPLPSSAHWAFTAPAGSSVPAVRDVAWVRTPVDRFIGARREQAGVSPAPEADRRTLIRRLSFDLRGIPPTLSEVREFAGDDRPTAWLQWVERFLASPQYGERWGRHWLDIAGYADSNGYFNADSDRPLAWQYRDYVVRSFAEDRPFDRFVREQVAGDELVGYAAEGDVTPDMTEALTATHFFRNPPDGSGESDGNPLEVKVDKYAVLEGNVQLIGHAFLGLTLQCARCHDHKFEPVTQAEYYGLQAVLRPALDPDRWLKPNERVVAVGTRAEREEHRRRTEAAERDLKTLRAGLDGLTKPFRRRVVDENLAPLDEAVRKAVREALDTQEKQRTAAMKALLTEHAARVEAGDDVLAGRFPELAAARRELEAGIRRLEAERPAPLPGIAALFEPVGPAPVHHVLVRGVHANEGAEAPPVLPASLAGPDAWARWSSPAAGPLPKTSGRRLALARWLTSPENPLVARVFVNRVWALHFGQGLVPTVDNLGRSGARPTHPELLDWLAVEFMRSGWSVKHLHRLILNSATWRQAGPEPGRADSPAELYAIHPLRRLDAETSRDAVLAVSGELDLRPHAGYVPVRTDGAGQIVLDEDSPDARRRSLYLQQRRTQPLAWLQVFDGPEPNPVCIQRNPATVPLQSLALLNSEFIRRHSRAFAGRVLQEGGDVGRAFEWAWSRPPTDDERAAAGRFLAGQTAHYAGRPDAERCAWTDFCQTLLAANPFLYAD